MRYLNSRQRLEMAFPAYFVENIWRSLLATHGQLKNGHDGLEVDIEKIKEDEEYCRAWAVAAGDVLNGIIKDSTAKQTDSHFRRVRRLYIELIDDVYAAQQTSIVKIAILYYQFYTWLKENHLDIPEDCALDNVSQALFNKINTASTSFDRLAKSGMKGAGRLIEALQGRGYYV